MPLYFQVIVILMAAWAGLVSLGTGRIYYRSGPSEKSLRHRLFGVCLLLVATTLALHWTGALPTAYQFMTPIVVGLLLVLALILAWLS